MTVPEDDSTIAIPAKSWPDSSPASLSRLKLESAWFFSAETTLGTLSLTGD